MQYLPFPVSIEADEAEIKRLARSSSWKPHEKAWLAAYDAYRADQGNPFKVTPHNFGPGVGDQQYKLYDSRRSSGELDRMRRKKGFLSCPVCGSLGTGTLDHCLPRVSYPEFSIMRANLVQACPYCNTEKGEVVHGDEPKRFLHPYFDQWAGQAIWYVQVVPPFEAAQFLPRPLPSLEGARRHIVEFHLEKVLGSAFNLAMENEWSSIPLQLKIREPDVTSASVVKKIGEDFRVASAKGVNSWFAALLRGIRQDPAALDYLQRKAELAELPPEE